MGLFGALSALLDENSDGSFEKKVNQTLDKVDSALKSGLSKAERGVAEVDRATSKASLAMDKIDNVSQIAEDKLKTTDGQ